MEDRYSAFNKMIKADVVFICKKPMKSIALTKTLQKIGFHVDIVSGVFDAVKLIEARLPRLVISDYELQDGSLIHLLDKLQADDLTSSIPIIAIVEPTNTGNLALLKGRSVVGVFKAGTDAKSILVKAHEVAGKRDYSGYTKKLDQIFTDNEIEIKVNLTVKGMIDTLLLIESTRNLAANKRVKVKKLSDGEATASFIPLMNYKDQEHRFVFTPIESVKGKSADWILNVNKLIGDETNLPKHKVLVYCKDNYNKMGLVNLLNTLGYEAEGAQQYSDVVRYVSKNQKLDAYGVILESPPKDELMKWVKFYNSLKFKPRTIIVTDIDLPQQVNVAHLDPLYSIESMLNTLNAVFAVNVNLRLDSSSNLEVVMSSKASIEIIDSTGGILRSEEHIPPGVEFEFENEQITKLLRGTTTLQVKHSIKDPEDEKYFLSKFEVAGASENKMKFIRQIEKSIAEESDGNLAS